MYSAKMADNFLIKTESNFLFLISYCSCFTAIVSFFPGFLILVMKLLNYLESFFNEVM